MFFFHPSNLPHRTHLSQAVLWSTCKSCLLCGVNIYFKRMRLCNQTSVLIHMRITKISLPLYKTIFIRTEKNSLLELVVVGCKTSNLSLLAEDDLGFWDGHYFMKPVKRWRINSNKTKCYVTVHDMILTRMRSKLSPVKTRILSHFFSLTAFTLTLI